MRLCTMYAQGTFDNHGIHIKPKVMGTATSGPSATF